MILFIAPHIVPLTAIPHGRFMILNKRIHPIFLILLTYVKVGFVSYVFLGHLVSTVGHDIDVTAEVYIKSVISGGLDQAVSLLCFQLQPVEYVRIAFAYVYQPHVCILLYLSIL